MSTIALGTGDAQAKTAEVVARFVFADETKPTDVSFDRVAAKRQGFSAKPGEVFWQSGADSAVVFVGLGPKSALDAEELRRAGAACVKATRSCSAVAIDISGLANDQLDEQVVAQSLGEGALLGSYRFDAWRSSQPSDSLERATLIGGDDAALRAGAARAELLSDVVCFARDLVNTPPSALTPRRFVELASERAEQAGLAVRVYDESELQGEGFGGLIGVSRGSAEPPRLLCVTYEPAVAATISVALVGKGVTFDSGGLSLKTSEGMVTMKTDMSGAAAVLGALLACRGANVPVRVVAYMPLTENMPGGKATKPGDVLKIRNGKTIEVIDTDAEGRLILADALSLAEEDHPDAIIDLATLTGACVAALGSAIAGLIGNDDRLLERVRFASQATGEPLWPLPLPIGYRTRLDSEVADMRNIAGTGSGGGALTAALLLEEFVGETPWVHLDIAGPARAAEDKGYLSKGGTGFGIRTLIELLERYEPLGGKAQGSLGKVVLH